MDERDDQDEAEARLLPLTPAQRYTAWLNLCLYSVVAAVALWWLALAFDRGGISVWALLLMGLVLAKSGHSIWQHGTRLSNGMPVSAQNRKSSIWIHVLNRAVLFLTVGIVLMIIIALIARDARIDYLHRTQVSGSMADAGGILGHGQDLKFAVAQHYRENGRFPRAGGESLAELGFIEREHNFLESIRSDGDSALVIRLRSDLYPGDSGVSPVAGKTLLLTYDKLTDTWGCASGGGDPVPEKYMPKGCD